MAGLLDGQGSMGPQMSPQVMEQLLAMLQQQNVDPMMKPLPGDLYLPGQAENPFTGGAPSQYEPRGQLPQELSNQIASSQQLPGLPNFPKQMGGFGFGSMVPKVFNEPKFMRPQSPTDLQGGSDPFTSNKPANLGFADLAGGRGSANPFLKQFLEQSLGQGGNIGATGQF